MSVTQWAEVEGKVHRLCQEFNHIHRGTVKQIFHLCNRDEEHCRRMLQTFNHPNAPGRQISAPSLTSPSQRALDIPNQHGGEAESNPVIPNSAPQPAQSSPLQPAATINLTLDDIMRLLHVTAEQYDGRTLPYLGPQPLFPHMPRGRGVTMPRVHYPTHPPHPVDHRPPTISPLRRGF